MEEEKKQMCVIERRNGKVMYDLVSGVNVAETRCLLVEGRGPEILARLGQHHHWHRRPPDMKVNLESWSYGILFSDIWGGHH